MQVTPRITPDGRVLMRVIPEISSISPSTVNLGNGNVGTIFNKQHLETTVAAADGETVMLGGLITKRDEKNENKIPYFGDLPGIGALFRYRTYAKAKTELIIIMTPHIIRNSEEAEQILMDESRRIDWNVGDVTRVHGSANCLPFIPPTPPEAPARHRPFRIFPGASPAGERVSPPTNLPEYIPPAPSIEPLPQSSQGPSGKGGLLQSIFAKPAPPSEPQESAITFTPGPSLTQPTPQPLIPTNPSIAIPAINDIGRPIEGR
jgi:hypothetical protein